MEMHVLRVLRVRQATVNVPLIEMRVFHGDDKSDLVS